MMTTITFLAAVFSLAIGIGVLWANPRRFTNQVFCVASVLIFFSMWFVFRAAAAGIHFRPGQTTNPVPWLKANAAVTAFVPWLVWLLKESLTTAEHQILWIIRRSLPWFGFGAGLALVSATDWYIPAESVPTNQMRGPGYVAHVILLSTAYVYLIGQTRIRVRSESGIRRIELQFLVLNLGIAGLLSVLLHASGNLLQLGALKRIGLLVILAAYALAAWAITFHRIFDARQIFLSLGQRVALLIVLALGIVGLSRLFATFLPPPADLFLGIALVGSAAFWLDRKSREWLDLGGERILAGTRRVVIELARTEFLPDELTSCFETLLRDQCQTSFVALLFDRGEVYAAGNLEFAKGRPGHRALCADGWATPESLERRRSDPSLDDLRHFLAEHSLGLVVAAPRGSAVPSLLVALGTKTTRWPFTYPEVQRLQNIAELMDNILTHSRLTMQAAQQAKMEHLAMMSRGLAHDLKNLITPISSFLVHTAGRFPAESPEAEVHSAANRSVRIMTDYVREALFFSERLAPKFEPVDLGGIFHAVRELMAAGATRRGVAVSFDPDYVGPVTADAVLLQRLLANLVGNAIDASRAGQNVTVTARHGRAGWLRLQVADEGCGIAPDDLARIFDPYFTTKEFGDEVRGFGLGLTICQKIADLHRATIAVQSVPGHGATFTVDLPATQGAPTPRPDARAP